MENQSVPRSSDEQLCYHPAAAGGVILTLCESLAATGPTVCVGDFRMPMNRTSLNNLINLITASPGPEAPAGTTIWLDLSSRSPMPKSRPWARGKRRGSANTVPWFPRTTKPRREGDRRWVYSPPGQLPGLREKGWFLPHMYCTRPAITVDGRPIGTLPFKVVQELHRLLDLYVPVSA